MDNRRLIKQFTDERGQTDMTAVIRERQKLAKVYHKRYRELGKHKSDSCIFSRYKSSAKRRELEFVLTLPDFASLLHKECDYCGKEDALGIDRVDSSLGYTASNVVPCCGMCNMMKYRFKREDFLKQCLKICERRKA